jgi:hypothetical protein
MKLEPPFAGRVANTRNQKGLSPWGRYFIERWADGLPIWPAMNETLGHYPHSEDWLRELARPLLGR